MPVVTCAHRRCRTRLDEHPVTCPHGLAFCGSCTWEETCSECATAAGVPDLDAALTQATATARAALDAVDPPAPRAETTCRCGHREPRPFPCLPVEDLRGRTDGVIHIERTTSLRSCHTCPHGVHVGTRCVRFTPHTRTSVAAYFYHPECAVTA